MASPTSPAYPRKIKLSFLSGDNVIFCPSVSEQLVVPEMDPLKSKRCPNGKELMIDVTIPVTYLGGNPYILRKPGQPVSLGRGSYMAAIEILSSKFGFKTVLTVCGNKMNFLSQGKY